MPVPTGPSLPVVMEQPSSSPVAASSPVLGERFPKVIKQEPPDDMTCPVSSQIPPQVSPSFPSRPGPQTATSPSFSTMVEFSHLALDSHRYAAPPSAQIVPPQQSGPGMSSVASLFGAVMSDTLETPPVLPGAASGAPRFPQVHQMSELIMDDGSGTNSPLLHAGDPMLSAHGGPVHPQLSPVQWDSATFSPDGSGGDQRMDMTS